MGPLTRTQILSAALCVSLCGLGATAGYRILGQLLPPINDTGSASCGNGMLEGTEQCDDANRKPGDGCNSSCKKETCGDGIVTPSLGEECDTKQLPTNRTQPYEGCSTSCKIIYCGDGIVQTELKERCDDGNAVANDGCNDKCQIELPKTACADGIDNDGDGAIDLRDRGCSNAKDTNEADGLTDLSVVLTTPSELIPTDSAYGVTMTVNNAGPDTATTKTSFAVNVPASAYFEPQNSSSICTEDSGMITCTVDRLAINLPYKLNLTFHVKTDAECNSTILHKATVASSPQGDPKTSNNTSTAAIKVKCGATANTCTDSDGGKPTDIAGTVSGTFNGNSYAQTDACEGASVLEYYCDGTDAKRVLEQCPNGCENGACKKAASIGGQCTQPTPTGSWLQNQSLTLDVNMNGVVDEKDARDAIAYINATTDGQMPPASLKPDTDGSTTVEPRDIILIINYLQCMKPKISLSSAVLGCVGGQPAITMNYAASGIDASLHALDAQRVLRHSHNWFPANKTSVTAPLSDFKDVAAGLQLMLCNGNDYTLCSGLVSVTGRTCIR